MDTTTRSYGRRGVIGLAVAGAVSIAGIAGVAAKGKPVTPPGKSKVAICHLDDATGLYSYKLVPPPAVKGHAKHGDVVEGVTGPETCDALNATPEPTPVPGE